MTSLRLLLLLAVCAGVALGPRAARAQNAEAAKAQARAHFDRALAASNEQRFDDAAREFEEAYALAPDFKVLYNIGRVSALMGRPLRAVEAFEGYLAQGGERVTEERRGEVQRLIDDQLPKLAMLGVEAPAGADVRVDGALVGQAPLPQRIRLVAGPHTVQALSAGHPPLLRELTLTGASTTDVVLAPPATPGPSMPEITLKLERPDDAPPPSHRGRRLAGYVTGGVGVLALVAGAVLAYQGALDANDAKASLIAAANPAPPGMPDVAKYDAARISYDDAKAKNQLGWAVAGVGGLAVLAGAALVLLSPSSATTPHVVAGRDTLGLGGRW